MTREQLYEFIVLTGTLNFTEAAKKLYISQSTLSRHITELEKELNVTLFYRTTHKVTLTTAGELFRQDARILLKNHDNTLHRLRYHNSDIQNSTCSVLCSNFALTPQLIQLLERFRAKYQEISLKLNVMPEQNCLEQKENYDIIISTFPFNDDSTFHSQLFSSYAACLVIPMNESFHSPHLAYLRELAGKNILLPYTDLPLSPFEKMWNKIDTATHHRATLTDCSNIETIFLHIAIGYGISIFPLFFSERLYKNTRIVHIADSDFKFDIFMHYNLSKASSAADLLCTELKTQSLLL